MFKVIFWTTLFLIFYTYIGYPILLFILSKLKKNKINYDDNYQPTVSLIIAAHNEEQVIADRLDNALRLDYPEDKLEIIVASDNSTDRTNEIVLKYQDKYDNVKLYEAKERKGKTNAQNEAVRQAKGEILAFSDANSMWEENALKKLVRNFVDDSIGYVCGKLSYINTDKSNASHSEGLYWKYELFLRKLESGIKSITAGNGAIYVVRNRDYEEIPILHCHDFGFPFRMVRKGKKAIYEEEAIAYEKAGESSEDELNRKVRMTGRIWARILNRIDYWNPFSLGILYSIFMISHRIFRAFLPFFHIGLLISSLFMVDVNQLYMGIFVIQVICYLLALIGYLTKSKFKLVYIPFYYCIFQCGYILGIIKYFNGEAKPFWEKVESTR